MDKVYLYIPQYPTLNNDNIFIEEYIRTKLATRVTPLQDVKRSFTFNTDIEAKLTAVIIIYGKLLSLYKFVSNVRISF